MDELHTKFNDNLIWKEQILPNCVLDDDECLQWNGKFNNDTPIMHINEKEVNVSDYVYGLVCRRWPLAHQTVVKHRCLDEKCILPEHLFAKTRRATIRIDLKNGDGLLSRKIKRQIWNELSSFFTNKDGCLIWKGETVKEKSGQYVQLDM